jgi:hypothetical protein
MTKQTFKKSLVALAVGTVCSSAAMAEDYTTGTLQGVVQDTAGNPVPNATVTVTSDKGVRRTVTADDDGSLRVPQLPIGTYTVTVTKDGYNELVSDNVPIQIGALGAFTFTMASASDEAMEEIYVTGTRQGSWDFNSTTTGITVDVGEAFSQAPLGRDATSVVLLAPGTSLGDSAFSTLQYGASGNIASFAGSSVGENVYYVNGMNITNFRNFVGGSTIPFELFDQIEVKTGGYQAEFGRSTGGVTNAVTKSGSNEWDFGVNAYFTPDSLYEDAPATFAAANQYDETESLEFNLWASGAIVKDKLFFFALYNPRDITEFDCASGSCTEETNDSPFYAVKLDFVPWEGHRAEYTFFSDDQTRDVATWRYSDAGNIATGDADAVANTPLSDFQDERVSDSKYVNGGENHIFRYTAALTDWMTLSALWGENKYQRSNYSTTDTPWTSSLIDPVTFTNGAEYDTGDWSVNLWEIGEDERENLRFDADFYFDLAGDHHIRLGWDQEDLTSTNDAYYSGNLRARAEVSALSPTGYRWRTRQYYNEGSFGTKQTAYYIQDSWQVLDNLTLNLGVRNETFENSNLLGQVYVETTDQVAPRLGFSWDPFNNADTRIYGSYGHYYLPIATNTNMRLAGQETYFQEYFEGFDADGDGFPDVGADNYPVLGNQLGDRVYFADGTMPFAEATKATDLDPLYQSEWILGIEHTFFDEWTFGIRYINRNLESLIEDVAIDAGVIAWAEANGYGDDPALATYSGFHQYVLVNPGSTFTTATVEDFGADGVVDFITITPDMLPYPEGERTYDAVDLTVERQWDEKWTFSAVYTWSESKGNYEGVLKSDVGQDDAGLTQDFDQPGLVDGSYGPTPNDREHRLKMRAAYAFNEQFQVNGAMYYESGRQFGCIGNHPTDYFAWNYGAASWYCGGELTPRGSMFESDALTQIDLSFVYTPRWTMLGESQLMFRVDVFNVLDADASVDHWEFGDISYSDTFHFEDPPALPLVDPNYGDITRYQAPRSIRFGASWNF